jgi:hypothetical protein
MQSRQSCDICVEQVPVNYDVFLFVLSLASEFIIAGSLGAVLRGMFFFCSGDAMQNVTKQKQYQIGHYDFFVIAGTMPLLVVIFFSSLLA